MIVITVSPTKKIYKYLYTSMVMYKFDCLEFHPSKKKTVLCYANIQNASFQNQQTNLFAQ